MNRIEITTAEIHISFVCGIKNKLKTVLHNEMNEYVISKNSWCFV